MVTSIFATMGIPKEAKLPPEHPLIVRASECADDVLQVVKEFPDQNQDTLARLSYVFAWKEGGCRADPIGHNDNGNACGVMQTWYPQWEVEGATCESVKKDRKLGLRVGMRRMVRLFKKCGGWGPGLTAYATNGACPDKWVLPLVKERCKLAGVECK